MIRAQALSKRYRLFDRPLDRVLQWVAPGQRGREFWALRDISFEIAPGSSLGIVGPNGAGKSTLLKILTGTTEATSGSFEIEGRVASLLELGMGFHPEFTGRQNVRFGARLAGLSDAEMEALLPAILDFSEIGDFIDQPVRTYSSGMMLRLGFALAASVEPDVLIVDEALAVGDLHFQQKCLARIRKIHESGATVLFVSHDPGLVKRFCTEAILLDHGKILDRGAPDHVIDYYTALLAERYREGGSQSRIVRPATKANADPSDSHNASAPSPIPPLDAKGHRTGNWRAVITGVWLESGPPLAESAPISVVATGGEARICIRWIAREAIPSATVGIAIKDRLGQEIYGVNTAYRGQPIENVAPGAVVETIFALRMNLGDGIYSVTAAVHEGDDHTQECFDWIEQALAFQVMPDPLDRFTGLCRLEPACTIQFGTASPADLARAEEVARLAESRAERA